MTTKTVYKKIVKEIVVEEPVTTITTYEVGDLFHFVVPNTPLFNKIAYVEKIGGCSELGFGGLDGYCLRSIPDGNLYWISKGHENDNDYSTPHYLGKFIKK